MSLDGNYIKHLDQLIHDRWVPIKPHCDGAAAQVRQSNCRVLFPSSVETLFRKHTWQHQMSHTELENEILCGGLNPAIENMAIDVVGT